MLIIENDIVYRVPAPILEHWYRQKSIVGILTKTNDMLQEIADELIQHCITEIEFEIRFQRACGFGDVMKQRIKLIRKIWNSIKKNAGENVITNHYKTDIDPNKAGNFIHNEDSGGYNLDLGTEIPCFSCEKKGKDYLKQIDAIRSHRDKKIEEPDLDDLFHAVNRSRTIPSDTIFDYYTPDEDGVDGRHLDGIRLLLNRDGLPKS